MNNLVAKITIEDELSEDMLAFIQHVGELIAQDYVKLLKQSETQNLTEGESNESSDICTILK